MSSAQASPPRWSPWSAPLALLLGLTLAVVSGAVVAAVSAAISGHADTPGANVVGTLLGDVCFIGGALILARSAGRITPEQFGLRRTPPLRAAGWIAAAYAAFLPVAALWLSLFSAPKKDPTLKDLGVDHSTTLLVTSMLVVCVAAPIAEEFLFRGYIFTALRNWSGPWVSALVTGLLFGALHVDPNRPVAYLVPLAYLGFLLCVIRWRTGSLYPCIGLHVLNNALAFGSTEGWSWQGPVLAIGALGTAGAILLAVQRVWSPAPA